MRHSTSRTSADRHASGMSRSTMDTVDDTKLMQEVGVSLFHGEKQAGVERFVQYGFTSVPQKPSGDGMMKKAAEAIFSFLGSHRAHGIAMMVGDRRFRLYKLADGEVAFHDDQGQQIHFQRDGIWASVPNSKQVKIQIMDDDKLPQEQASGGSDPQGQIKQAGRPAGINLTIDKNQFTLNHPNGAVNFNCKSFTVNASNDAKIIAGGNALMRGVNAIVYATTSVFLKAVATINAKSSMNLATPAPWAEPAGDPPISQ